MEIPVDYHENELKAEDIHNQISSKFSEMKQIIPRRKVKVRKLITTYYDDIVDLLEKGWSTDDIVSVFVEAGLEINPGTFKVYLAQERKARVHELQGTDIDAEVANVIKTAKKKEEEKAKEGLLL